MNYTILETHTVYKNEKLDIIAVLWQSNSEQGWVRASYFTSNPYCGYGFLMPDDKFDDNLIQKIAGQGANLPDNLKRKFFPSKRKWER